MDFTSRSNIAKAAIIGIFLLVGTVVSAGALLCDTSCPVFSQVHFDRFVDLIMYMGFGGAVYIGIRMTRQSRRDDKENKTKDE